MGGLLGVVLLALSVFTAPAVAQAQAPKTKVTIAQGGEGFVWLALYVARGMNAFKEEGLDVDVVTLPGGSAVLSALIGGSATVAATSLSQVIKADEKSLDLVAFVNILDEMTMPVVVSNTTIRAKNLNVNTPAEDRIRALKGMRIGVTTPGSGTDLFVRDMLKRRGIDPNKDVTLITFDGQALEGALEHDLIDAYMYTSPLPELAVTRGAGTIWVNPSAGDIPELTNFTYVTLFTTRKNLTTNPDLFKRIARATVRAMNFAHEHPKEAVELIAPFFPNVDPKVLQMSFANTVQAVPTTGKFHQRGVDLNLKWYGKKQMPFEMLVTNDMVQ